MAVLEYLKLSGFKKLNLVSFKDNLIHLYMSKSNKYKSFTELKESIISTSVSENRIVDMIADIEDFVKKIKHSQKNVNVKSETLRQSK